MDIVEKLKSIVGPDRVSTSKAVCRSHSYSSFWGRTWLTIPDMVVVASTTEQVSDIIKAANHYKVPVTPKGPVGMGGMGGPIKGGILLDVSPMDENIIDVKNQKVIAGAGGSFFKLSQELFKEGLLLPTAEYGPGPTVAASAVTPVVAFGKTRYGRNIDLVEGFEVVLPEGDIVRVGSMAYADSDFGPYYRYITGPDLVGMFTQANGAYGIITKVAYSCIQRPKHWAFHSYYWSLEQIHEFTDVMMQATALEMFDFHFCDKWRYEGLVKADLIPPMPDDCHFHGYLTITADSSEELQAKENIFHELCKSKGGSYLPGAGEKFFGEWPNTFCPICQPMLVKLFESARETSGATGLFIADSIDFPTSWFPEVYMKLKEVAENHGLWGDPYTIVFDGWPIRSQTMCSQTWLFTDFYDEEWMGRVMKYKDEFREWFGARGGTLQMGVPPYPEFTWNNQKSAHWLMDKIKKMLDPNDILSPGTFDIEKRECNENI